MTDITGGDIEIIGRLMSAERLAVKRAHAARHPEGRMAELIAHIEAQDEMIRELREAVREARELMADGVTYVLGEEGWGSTTGERMNVWLAAHKEE